MSCDEVTRLMDSFDKRFRQEITLLCAFANVRKLDSFLWQFRPTEGLKENGR